MFYVMSRLLIVLPSAQRADRVQPRAEAMRPRPWERKRCIAQRALKGRQSRWRNSAIVYMRWNMLAVTMGTLPPFQGGNHFLGCDPGRRPGGLSPGLARLRGFDALPKYFRGASD